MDGLLIVPIVLPVLAGALLVILAFREQLAEVRNVGSGKIGRASCRERV